MCGKRTVPSNSICDAVQALNSKIYKHDYQDSGKSIAEVANLCRSIKNFIHWFQLMDITGHCKYSDPRDRPVLHFIGERISDAQLHRADLFHELGCIESDYTKPVEDIYREAMTHYTKSQEACYLLRKIERHEDNPGRMPTWVPNWDIPRATVALEPQLASLMSESEFAFPSTGVFEATGVFVAKVKHVEQVGFISEADPGSFLAIIKDLGTRIVPLLKPENTTSLRAVCMALIAGRLYKDSYRPPRDARPERADVEAVFENILLERKARDLSLQAAHSFFLRARYLRGRASFVTHDDRVGLGPRFMQAGDILTVLLGLYLAVVLRPTSSSSSEYEVIGEAYCDGFMEGEALLSPLPGAWDIVRRDHASGPSFVAFIDRDDGTVQPEDPRLAGLPKGWTRKPHADEQTYTWFVDEDSEEQFWGGGDPRLRAEVLKERGVPLQNFRLV